MHDRRLAVQDAMAAAGVAGGDAGDFERDNGGVKQRDEPADRANETLGLAGAPVHVLGPVEGENFFGQLGGQHFGGGAACALHGRADVFAFGRGDFLERGDGDAGLFGEGFGSGCGLAVFEGYLPRGADELLFGIGLARRARPRRARRGGAGWSRW